MKTVFSSHAMTAHVWAQASQNSGRSGDGRMFFEGRALYSYGSHFCLGYIHESGVALLNSDSYSVSTSKHKSHTWRAVRHLRTFDVPGLTKLVRYDGLRNPAAIVAHVESNALAMSDESGAFLLRLAKSRKSFATIRAKAEAKRDAAAAKAKRDALAAKVATARKLASATDSEFNAALATKVAGIGAAMALADMATRYRAAARAAARFLSDRAKARSQGAHCGH